MPREHPLKQALQSKNLKLDEWIVAFVTRHGNLMMAACCVGLAVWGAAYGHAAFTFGLALMGGIGYFVGIFTAIVSSFLYLGLDLLLYANALPSISPVLIETIGYLGVSWLGYRHKRLKEAQEMNRKPNQILPWTVVNDMRTSLSAIRFLLFPLEDHHKDSLELKQATDEITRLEQLFRELENK